MEFELKELVEFAKKNHYQFGNFSEENITKFFEMYKKNVIVRQNKLSNKINGFAVIISISIKKIEIITVCLIGDYGKNRRDMLAFLHRWKSVQVEVIWQRETTGSNVFGLLADAYELAH